MLPATGDVLSKIGLVWAMMNLESNLCMTLVDSVENLEGTLASARYSIALIMAGAQCGRTQFVELTKHGWT